MDVQSLSVAFGSGVAAGLAASGIAIGWLSKRLLAAETKYDTRERESRAELLQCVAAMRANEELVEAFRDAMRSPSAARQLTRQRSSKP